MIEIKTLSQTSTPELLDCFNLAFSDYLIPMKLNLEQLEHKIKTEDIDKEISVGAFKGQRLLGFVLHGDRQMGNARRAYNGGTGVIPAERGQKLTQRMYDFIKPKLEAKGFAEVVLEVISNNAPAIRSYEKIGFQVMRNVSCYKGDLSIKAINEAIVIKQVGNANFSTLNPIGEIRPTWQNDDATILNLGRDALCFLAYLDTELCGYVVLNKRNNRILQIAVAPVMRKRLVGSSLLQHVKDNVSASVSIINVDSNFHSALQFLENSNLEKTITQEEMRLML